VKITAQNGSTVEAATRKPIFAVFGVAFVVRPLEAYHV
jgi:hypothetical protein